MAHFIEYTFLAWGGRAGKQWPVSLPRVLLTNWLMFLIASSIISFVFINFILCLIVQGLGGFASGFHSINTEH